MNKTILLSAGLFGVMAVMPVSTAFASGTTPTPTKTPTPTPASNCQPNYGGGSTCETTELLLDKTVKNPSSSAYVDNLGVNDTKYTPSGTVYFKLRVQNTGNKTLSKVTITDTLPEYLTFTDGDSKTHTFTIDDLKPNESRTIDVSAKIASSTALPKDQGITCIVNKAEAKADDHSATDTSQFCVEKQVLGTTPTTKGGLPVYPTPTVKKTPPTGPETLALVGLVPSSLFGLILRKRAGR